MPARDMDKVVTDSFVGKLGELAVQKWLSENGVQIELDWTITPRGQWDISDVSFNGWSIDVKCTKSTGRYFLIEWSKLQFRADAGELPHFFLMTRLKSMLTDIAKDGSQDCTVELAGFIDTSELEVQNSRVLTIRRGEVLPSTGVLMAALSFAVPIKDLHEDWDNLAARLKSERAFSLDAYNPPGNCEIVADEEEPIPELPMKYSLLLAGNDVKKYSLDDLEGYIKEGIKCIIFTDEAHGEEYACLGRKYGRMFFQIYKVTEGKIPALTVYDGKMDEKQRQDFEELCGLPLASSFNKEQYEVEHFDTEKMLIVKASAGTGKTTVMIDRIMFLLATVEKIRPADIAMITFTNKATANMIEKLQKRALGMYNVTRKRHWYEIMEQLSQMQISTIDSFFYTVLKADGSVLGYGTDSSIKSFVYERKRILREIINDLFKAQNAKTFLDTNVMAIHEYVNRAFELWEKIRSRGYFGEAITGMDFGTAAEVRYNIVNANLQKIIIEAEKRYQLFKKKHNAYTLSDIKADMDAMSHSDDFIMRQNKYRFLFIDEFQDTDNSQIRSAAWLQKVMGCQLFVVGDVKQSIYRFRGAEESAFCELEKSLLENGVPEDQICEMVLKINYRTAEGVMNAMNNLFASWGDKNKWDGDELLAWDGRVIPHKKHRGSLHTVVSRNKSAAIIRQIKYWRENSKQVCVLARGNRDVETVASLCRQENIPCVAKLRGGFYNSEPVRDMHALLGAMLYPEDTRRLYNLLLTSYTTMVPDGETVARMHGDEEQVRSYLEGLLARDGWHGLLQRQCTEPFFAMLDKILDQMHPLERYKSLRQNNFPLYKKNGDVDYDTDFYLLNLNKLMRILYENFTGEYASLLGVFAFLENKIQTDWEEECVYPDKNSEKSIEIMTVHKAKGLEYETVIIPWMSDSFFKNENREKFVGCITDELSGRLTVGWSFKHNNKFHKNNYYASETEREHQAIRREEARILYVAMTRAEENLILFNAEEPKDDTWDEYVQECEEVR